MNRLAYIGIAITVVLIIAAVLLRLSLPMIFSLLTRPNVSRHFLQTVIFLEPMVWDAMFFRELFMAPEYHLRSEFP